MEEVSNICMFVLSWNREEIKFEYQKVLQAGNISFWSGQQPPKAVKGRTNVRHLHPTYKLENVVRLSLLELIAGN